LDPHEPEKVAESVKKLGLRHVVITSVDRDDLEDGGAAHFSRVISNIRKVSPSTTIEILTPDFLRKPEELTVDILATQTPPDVYNHNIETVERLQGVVRRGAKYQRSLDVLRWVKEQDGSVATKSGLMLGHGETEAEIIQAMEDLRAIDCDRLTLGQYMRPSLEHLPVKKYWTPAEFDQLGAIARSLGFIQVRSGPLVRSSYHAGEEDISDNI
jgi:lipoic acid synthetase